MELAFELVSMFGAPAEQSKKSPSTMGRCWLGRLAARFLRRGLPSGPLASHSRCSCDGSFDRRALPELGWLLSAAYSGLFFVLRMACKAGKRIMQSTDSLLCCSTKGCWYHDRFFVTMTGFC